MTPLELRDDDTDEQELRRFRRRLKLLGALALICIALLMARAFWLQVLRHDDYAAQAEQNRHAAAASKNDTPAAGDQR